MPPRPLPNIPGTVRCAVQGLTPSGQPWVNVHHMRYADGASAPGPTEIAALDVQLDKLYGGPAYASGVQIMGSCRSSCTMTQIVYTPLDGASTSTVIPHNHAGTDSTTISAPSNSSFVLTLRTNHRGRRYRGRVYLPPFGFDVMDGNGRLVVGTATGIVNQYNGMKTALGSAQWRPVVASYGVGSDHGTPTFWTPFATDIITVTMDLLADAQRRRK